MKTNQVLTRKMGQFDVLQRTSGECLMSFLNGNDYVVKSDGEIISVNYNRTRSPKRLKQSFDKDGYKTVNIYYDKKSHRMKVHRLVALCFLPNPKNLPEVNHKDEDKTNNLVDNIEWCATKYNLNYGTRNLRISRSKTNGSTSKKVVQIERSGRIVKIWDSVNEAQRFGFNQATISKVASFDDKYSRYKTHKGFIWKYL